MNVKRIGLIADAHSHAPGASDLPQGALEALRGVDLIIPLGDIGEAAALDRLEEIAPIQPTRGEDDPRGDARLEPRRVIEVGGVTIGALFALNQPGNGVSVEGGGLELPDKPVAELLTEIFGRSVDVVVYGATHQPFAEEREGVLFVNPGSPTYAESKSVAVLEIRDGKASAEIVKL